MKTYKFLCYWFNHKALNKATVLKKYQIIYADPPWTYHKSGGVKSSRGLAKAHYSTMNIEQIKALDIDSVAAKNCYLFLWVTAPRLQEGLDVLKAWGFEFFTIAFTWIKTNKKATDTLFWGMGSATRANPEYVLLGRRGQIKRQSASVHSVVMSIIGNHSKKPHEVRKRIEQLYGDLPRIELFAREENPGWDAWGNEVTSDVKINAG